MKPTNFSKNLTDFLSHYLPSERGASKNTISSYRDTFILFLLFFKKKMNVPAEKLTFSKITKEAVVKFLNWLEEERRCRVSTRNVRLAAIHSFFQYIQYINPENMIEAQKILSIPVKKAEKSTINYLSIEGIRLILECPDQSTERGLRDLTLLSLMYDSAARVQEIIDLTPSMVRLELPYTIKLVGKGNKARIVPLLEQQVKFLKRYMKEQKLLQPYANMYPLFSNCRKEKFTRAGLNYILAKFAKQARIKKPSLVPEKVTCHCLRHSKAMHLLQSGVNLVYIRDILGHTSIQVTEIYAKTDSLQKRKAIEEAYSDTSPQEVSSWMTNGNLLNWLKSFNC